jgi:membrane protein
VRSPPESEEGSPGQATTWRSIETPTRKLPQDLTSQVLDLVHRLVEPVLRLNALDRSLALGAQAFGALIPLLILLEAVEPGDADTADELIARFDLHGSTADVVREAFQVTGQETSATALSVFLLVVSVLSFTRRLQRLYEDTWGFPQRGIRGTGWGLAWIGVFAVYAVLHPALDGLVDGAASMVASIGGAFAIGLLTPYVLLGRRLPWRRLVFQAGVTAAGLTALAIWSAIYMPRAIASSAAAYGAIGIAFALLTWLWGLGIVLVAAAILGSPQMRWRPSGSPAAGEGIVGDAR